MTSAEPDTWVPISWVAYFDPDKSEVSTPEGTLRVTYPPNMYVLRCSQRLDMHLCIVDFTWSVSGRSCSAQGNASTLDEAKSAARLMAETYASRGVR